MGERLTKHDVEKIEKEIEYRKLVVRKDAIEAVKRQEPRAISAKILNTMRQKKKKIRMRAGSGIWREC